MEHNYSHSESSGDDEENNTPTNDLTKHKNVFGETSSEEGSVKHSSSSEDHEEDNKINHESTKEKNPQSLISDVESANESESSDNSSGDELQPTNEVQEKAQKDNLFGDADDISSDDEDDVNKDNEETVQTKEVLRTESGDDEDDDANFMQNEQKQQMDTRIEVEIPKITTDLGSAVHFVRFPNFISVEARPFDAAVYEDEIEEDELLDEEGRTRLKLKVENTIRWRKYIDENAIELIESNARIVKWSDGSMSMHLGSEIFDVHQMSIQGDHNHLFIRQGTGLQGQAVFKTKLTFRPNSTKSATHKKMTNRLAMRHNQNQQKVRVLPIAGQDPESRKADLMKVEEGLLKAHVRREALKRRIREKSHMRGLSSNYVEDDDNNGDSISAIKNEFKSGARHSRDAGYNIGYESDEDRQKLLHSKRFGSDDEYDDDILGTKRKRDEDGEVRRKTYVLSDEEDDDDFANDNSQTSDNEQQSSQSS